MKRLLAVFIALFIVLSNGVIFAQAISISLVGVENGETLTQPVSDDTSTGQITNSRKINFVIELSGVYKKTPISFLAKKEDTIVGLDQIFVNKGGRYTHSLALSTTALWGDKIDIVVLPDKNTEQSIRFSIVLQYSTGDVYKPVLSNVSLSTDKPHLGQEVSVNYDISCDIHEDYTDHSIFQWYNAAGNPILGANKRTIIVPPECYDSPLQCEITPRIITKTGAEYFGDPVLVQSSQKVVDIMYVYDVKMDSSYKVGDTITVSYKYSNLENSDDDSIITWYRGGTKISDAVGAKYVLTQSDVGEYIKARITVRSKSGKFGTTPLSPQNQYVEITSPVTIQDTARTSKSTKGGGGGGRSSVSYTTNNDEVKVPFVPSQSTEFVPTGSTNLGARKFIDVDPEKYNWAIGYLDTLVQDGIIVGTDENTFSPEDYLTQAQYLALLMRIFDNIHINNENITNWEEFIVEQANQNQLGMFIWDPNAPITRELMARATYAAIKNNNMQLTNSGTKIEFKDIDMLDSVTKNAINFLSECGILSGTGGGNFSPNAYTTRIQGVKVIGKIYLQTDKKIAAHEKETNEYTVRYEAEDAIIEGGCIVDNNHAGYSGTGFISEHKWIGARVSFVVNVPKSGDYQLIVRYAAGIHGVVDEFGRKSLSLYVNDEKVKQLIIPLTGEWNIWGEVEERIVLNSGQNIISFRIDDGDTGTVNLDCIDIKAIQ